MAKYTIGVDFGTLSGRALLIDCATGKEMAESVFEYPHGVMDRALPDGTRLGVDWALQHPGDYIDTLCHTVREVIEISGVAAADIIGIATDFTACTLIPVKEDGTPLCMLEAYKSEPHAYVKLWKHHAAQDEANRLNAIAGERGEGWLKNYGGKISSEWAVPKIWQVLNEAPEIYDAADKFVEAADWIVWQLCGSESRNSCTAGYKEIYNKTTGYPSIDFFRALDPKLENILSKLGEIITPLGTKVGVITKEMAEKTGLKEGVAVAAGNVDAHVCVPAVGIDGPGKMLAIMGTSTCHMIMSTEEKQVPGMCGVVADGIMPGFYGYEAGQSCVGDHFSWFIENCLPASYYNAAKAAGTGIHQYLEGRAREKKPGESGLLALDWWNGNRSVLVDVDLTGMIIGCTLLTQPEDIYRALIEATAYGTKVIVDNYRDNGVEVNEFYASGGISQKNPLMMQIYADVLDMPVKIASATHGPAYGSAIFAAVAAGKAAGGYDNVAEAARAIGAASNEVYLPISGNADIYKKLFTEYLTLHDYFGRGENDVMKRLKSLQLEVTSG
ncbi:MAG: ribulokinase [Oscillospiraceae bacterium]|nr:ribulokinase [Oscillospiraceae bacterium]